MVLNIFFNCLRAFHITVPNMTDEYFLRVLGLKGTKYMKSYKDLIPQLIYRFYLVTKYITPLNSEADAASRLAD